MALNKHSPVKLPRVKALQPRPRHHADTPWHSSDAMRLLQGSGDYFPALIAAIDAAQDDIYFETYIFDPTGSGQLVAEALMRAAQRGVRVRMLLDGIGSASLNAECRQSLKAAGITLRMYAPPNVWFLLVPRQWQRLHRKLCAIDESTAFCGGINVLDDHYDPNHGHLDAPRLDFSVQVFGNTAAHIRQACVSLWRKVSPKTLPAPFQSQRGDSRPDWQQLGRSPKASWLLLRDNLDQRRSIERSYLRAIAQARQSVTVANAYFFPSRKLMRALQHAAERGVRVRLLLQGRYEYFLQYHASRAFYAPLLAAGVEIYAYTHSFLHAKVATIDPGLARSWATVGSSNLDPLSLLLAKEANIVSYQKAFALELQQRLDAALAGGQRIDLHHLQQRSLWQRTLDRSAYWLARSMVGLVKDKF